MLRLTRRIVQQQQQQQRRTFITGCGSNVVDQFYRVRAIPKPGEKGYFAHPCRTLESSLVGGVTLNHLAWARCLGVPSALLACQGRDSVGELIRGEMKRLGVDTRFVAVGDEFASSVSYVWLQPDGERSIIMAPASTGDIGAGVMRRLFVDSGAVEEARLVSTEISQVPLDGVLELLRLARERALPTVLDVDVTPTIATTSAGLGTMEQVFECVKASDVIKPSLEAAHELIEMHATKPEHKQFASAPIDQIAVWLQEIFGSKLVAVTNGSNGCGIANREHSAHVPVFDIGDAVDATGAGDAFLGGMLAGLYRLDAKLEDLGAQDLHRIAALASAAGASCASSLGALPDPSSSALHVQSLLPDDLASLVDPTPVETEQASVADVDTASIAAQSVGLDAAALSALTESIESQTAALEALLQAMSGQHVYVSGIGKSGVVGQRLAAALSSLGQEASFVHASEWLHGDLGKLQAGSVVVLLSHSGNTPELVELLRHFAPRGVVLAAVVGNAESQLGTAADIVIEAPATDELLGKVPTRSIVVQEAVVNAICTEVVARDGFQVDQFVANHPGGAIGAEDDL